MDRNLPYGGREIENLRMAGKRPADMVLVSLIGPLDELNPVVTANPEKSYGWKFLSGLEVMIVANSKIQPELVKRAIDAISQANPGYLGMWFADKNSGQHISWGSFKPKSKSFRWMTPSECQNLEGVGYANYR